MNWLQSLFDASDFMPRCLCGAGWTSTLIFVVRVANLLSFVAYIYITFTLLRLWWWQHRREQHAWMVWIVALFMGSCGLSHLGSVLVFFWPAYRLFALNDGITALTAVWTALSLSTILSHITQQPSKSALQVANKRLAKEAGRAEFLAQENARLHTLLLSQGISSSRKDS